MKKQYQETAIDIITNSNIIEKEDLNILSEIKEELRDSFLFSQMFRTRTEIEVSVLNDLKFPTADSKYWQSVREQNVMFEQLTFLSYEYRKKIVEIKKLKRDILTESDNLEIEIKYIELDKFQFELRQMEKTAKARIREIKDWHDIKERLIPQLKGSLTDCDDHQLISYTKRWIKQAKTMGTNGSPSERQNLLGQLNSGVKKCIERKVIHNVLADFSNVDIKKIVSEYGLDEHKIFEEIKLLK